VSLFRKPFVMPEESITPDKLNISVSTVKVDDLFGKPPKLVVVDLFADNMNQKQETSAKEETRTDLIDTLDTTGVVKKWFISTPDDSCFGPYSSREIYHFLNYFFDRHPELMEEHTFMVADFENDIFYLPDMVIEMLAPEIKDKGKQMSDAKDLERKVLRKIKRTDVVQRQFVENPRLITKYDVFEMNSKFKTPHDLPINGLKEQLKHLGQRKNMTYYEKPIALEKIINTNRSTKEMRVVDINDLFV
jgi:hypothetical protein